MKRYRVIPLDFDSRATTLRQEINPEWEESVRKRREENIANVRNGLLREFGELAADAKLRNFVDVGPTPFSVLAFHNRFAAQARRAFVIGAYYPALTGACALGERMLNHLILRLRNDYRHTPEYKHVCRKDSFDRWHVPIDALASWGVLLPEATEAFRELEKVRNRAIHFYLDTDTNDRAMALDAIQLLNRVIIAQFASMGLQPWFIPDVAGEAYIKREWEARPFIREVYLPNCVYVGPSHRVEQVMPKFVVSDHESYPNREISDEQFVALRLGDREAAPDV